MKEFLFLYRTDYEKMLQASSEQAEAMMKKWMDWLNSIAAQNKLSSEGNRLNNSGRLVKADIVTNGPYMEIKESIGGYSIITAEDYDKAIEFAKNCPVLLTGGNVEIREIDAM